MGGRGSRSGMSSEALGTRALSSAPRAPITTSGGFDEEYVNKRIGEAIANGYKSPLVNKAVTLGSEMGYKEQVPLGNQRSMLLEGGYVSGGVKRRSVDVTVTENGVILRVDPNKGDYYSDVRAYNFGSGPNAVSNALQSGKNFVTNRKAYKPSTGISENDFISGNMTRTSGSLPTYERR